jgi:hypothetical protein
VLRTIGEHGVTGATVNECNVAEDANLRLEESEILERPGLRDVFEVLLAVSGDPRGLHDEVLSKELAEALGVAGLVRLVVVEVELLEDCQVLGRLLVVVDVLVPSLCGSALTACGSLRRDRSALA